MFAEKHLTIAVGQVNPILGDIAHNQALILDTLRAHHEADLVVLSECVLTGYPLEDLVLRPTFMAAVRQAMDAIADAVRALKGPALLYGAPVAGADLPFNAAVLVQPDGTMTTAVKVELPNVDVFDEVRTFAAGQPGRPLLCKGFRLGVMVCEDMWHGRVARALADELADVLIVINGSPFETGKQDLRLAHAGRRVRQTGLPLIYVNQVGGQDELVFDGGSFAMTTQGHVALQMPFGVGSARVRLSRLGQDPVVLEPVDPLEGEAYPEPMEATYRACLLGLRDYVNKNGFPGVVLGISGGIDSGLVAALAVDALGPERVTGVMMPSEFTSNLSTALAEDLMQRLGCAATTVPIAAPVAAVGSALAVELGAAGIAPAARAVAEENIQARLRGMVLMAVSNATGALVLSTGNKSEMSVGYATLYGDMCGGFNPLKDIYKTTVFALSRWRNAHRPAEALGPVAPIPEGIITRPPSAELRADQTDEAALGPYEELDALLEAMIEDQFDPETAALGASRRLGRVVSVEAARRVARLLKGAEYKRRQAPPGVKLTRRSFGKGWRYPITNRFVY